MHERQDRTWASGMKGLLSATDMYGCSRPAVYRQSNLSRARRVRSTGLRRVSAKGVWGPVGAGEGPRRAAHPGPGSRASSEGCETHTLTPSEGQTDGNTIRPRPGWIWRSEVIRRELSDPSLFDCSLISLTCFNPAPPTLFNLIYFATVFCNWLHPCLNTEHTFSKLLTQFSLPTQFGTTVNIAHEMHLDYVHQC